ncbi:MAG: hypothetical protein AAFU85_13885 [Planctomycetota bacterium]
MIGTIAIVRLACYLELSEELAQLRLLDRKAAFRADLIAANVAGIDLAGRF